MKLILGDDVGQLKVISTSRGIDTTLPTSARADIHSFLTPNRKNPIFAVHPVRYRTQNLVAVASKTGLLRILSPDTATEEWTAQMPLLDGASIIAFGSAADEKLYAAASDGSILILDLSSGESSASNIGGPLSAFSMSADGTHIAVGGETRELEILEYREKWISVWKAKNVRANKLKVVAPVWVRNVFFLPAKDGWRVLVGTQYGSLRLYETAVSRRPVWSAEVGTAQVAVMKPASSMPDAARALVAAGMPAERAVLEQKFEVVWADEKGVCAVYSLRQRRELGRFHGPAGAILGVWVDLEAGLVATTGWDRYVFVYEKETRELVSRVYVKTVGRCVAVLEGEDEVVPTVQAEEEKEEDVWDGIEEVGNGGSDEGEDDEGDLTSSLAQIKRPRKENGDVGPVRKRKRKTT